MQLNLNLLTVLHALLEEQSVMKAALRLHLSQPAVSRALGRIRAVTGDAILVRSGRVMMPTPRALAMQDEVRLLVQSAESILSQGDSVDLQTLDRVFTIRVHELLAGTLARELISRTSIEAPNVRLRFLEEAPRDGFDYDLADVDLSIGGARATGPNVRQELIAEGHLCVVMRADHALAGSALTATAFASARHILVSRRGVLRDEIDDRLKELGLSRRVTAAVAHSVDAFTIVAKSDAVCTIPSEISRGLVAAFELVTTGLPFDAAPIPAVAYWHRRFDSDPAHLWLRQHVVEALQP